MEISGVSGPISEADTIEKPIDTGRLSSVVSSADCRSANTPRPAQAQVSEAEHEGGDGATGNSSGESAKRIANRAMPDWFRRYVHGSPTTCSIHPSDTHPHNWSEEMYGDWPYRKCGCGVVEFQGPDGEWRESMESKTGPIHHTIRTNLARKEMGLEPL